MSEGSPTIWSSSSDLWCRLQAAAAKTFNVVISQVSGGTTFLLALAYVRLNVLFNGIIPSTEFCHFAETLLCGVCVCINALLHTISAFS